LSTITSTSQGLSVPFFLSSFFTFFIAASCCSDVRVS
jgi:hypothetical protein